MKKTHKLLKVIFVMLALLAFASMLFLTSCDHDLPQDESGTENTQDSGNDNSNTTDNKNDSNDEPEQDKKDPESTLKIVLGENNQVKFSYSNDTVENTLKLTAEDGYDSYEWLIFLGIHPEQKTEKSITFSLEDVADNFYVLLGAKKNGIIYTTNILIDMCPPVIVDIKNIDFVSSTETDVVFNVEIEKPVSKDFAKFVVREYQNVKTIAESKEGTTNVTLTLKQESLNDKKGHVFELISVDNSGNESAPLLFGLAKCGDNLFTTQIATMTGSPKSINIVGSGAMYDYESDKDSPFYKVTDFSCITISKDCTKFGKYAFPSISTKEPIRVDRDIELSPLSFKKDTMVILSEMDCDDGDGTLYAQVVAVIGEDTVGYMLAINGEGYMKDCGLPGVSYPWESYKDKIQMVYIGSGCKTIEQWAFGYYPNLSQLVFEENSTLDSIKDTAFSGTAIEKLEVPASVISLNGFSNCKNLKEVIFAEDCKLSGISGFHNTAIEKIKIPASVQTIGQNAFRECTELKELTFESPSNLLRIENSAFKDTMLKEVTLPTSKNGDATIYNRNSFPEDCTVTGGKIQE